MAEQDQYDTEFVLHSVGDRLRIAREAAGLSRADIAARTKIAERHLTAIEQDRFDDLASSTYAVGFARAYARTVGLDEADIARQVRSVLEAGDDDVLPAVTFEPGDPARIPTPRLAWFAAVGIIAVVAAIFLFWRSYFTPAVSLPDLTRDETAVATTPAPAPEASLPAPLPSVPAAIASAPALTGTAATQPPAVTGPRPQQARPAPRAAPSPAATSEPRPAPSSAPASERPQAPEPASSPTPAPAQPSAPAAAAAGASAQGDAASTVSP